MSAANCIFCKIIKGTIPSLKLLETEHAFAFMDINPLSKGHLVIPKYHAQYLHELPDESLREILPVVKKVAVALGGAPYNVLQNNGRLAHQVVDHVHFHVIPRTETTGLEMQWDSMSPSKDDLSAIHAQLVEKLNQH